MANRHYPSQHDMTGPDKLERVFRDVYDRLYTTREETAKKVNGVQSQLEQSVVASNAAMSQLLSSGAMPSSVPDTAKQIKVGLYADRPATFSAGDIYYATDQNTAYIVDTGAWVWLAGLMFGATAARPVLVAGDAGFRFFDTTLVSEIYWGGAAWVEFIPDATAALRGAVSTGTQSFAGAKTFTGSVAVTGALGCNAATPQTAYASGGALAAYSTGAFGLDSDAHMQALFDMVVKIRAALVANGIMS
jgi:hypothetical protein